MQKSSPKNALSLWCYRAIRWVVRLFFPKYTVEGLENLPQGPCIVAGNHAQMNGPIACELYFPGRSAIWCTAEMMQLHTVPSYAYTDFWSQKPRWNRWFYRLLSYIIAPVSVCIFHNAHTIPVYHDSRIMSTFRQTVEHLQQGQRVVIFPEHTQPYNRVVNHFQDKFIDTARLYYRRTGEALSFVPLYVAPAFRKLYLGKPITFDPHIPVEQERQRICQHLMDAVTALAQALPCHTVTPYDNIPKRNYPQSRPPEVSPSHEETCC